MSTAASQSLALQRILTHKRQHAETVGARKPTKLPLYELNIGAGKPFPEQLPASSEYVVEFDDAHDPLHPQNWEMTRKYAAYSYRTISRSLILLS
jgi:DHA1 family multidrug resistance protein-like MFS transporter